MQQQTVRRINDFSHSVQLMLMRMMRLTLVLIMLLQHMMTTDAAQYKGDNCMTKNQPGICKEWSECPVIKTLIESGEYTKSEVKRCGFGILEELICCPVIKTESKIESTTDNNDDRFQKPSTTQAPPKRDFWLDLLQNTTSSTTATPDFWLDLLKTTTTSTTTTTTPKPLIVRDQKLNEKSEFFDFNVLLGGNQNGASKPASQTNQGDIRADNNPSNNRLIAANHNGRANSNSLPFNTNQWGFQQTGNGFNNAPANNNNANFGRGQGQGHFNRGQHMGRGPFNNNGHGNINGHGPHNNGGFRNNMGSGNQNGGFAFANNNMRPHNFFGEVDTPNLGPGRPVNNMQEQNPNIPFTNPANNNDNKNSFNNSNENKKVEELIENIFNKYGNGKANTDLSAANNNHGNRNEKNIEDSIANIFNINKTPTAAINPPHSHQPVVWLQPNSNRNNHKVEYAEFNMPHHQMALSNPQPQGHFEIIPVVGDQIASNDLDVAPSSSFIQQPVVVETLPGNPVHRQDFNPVQVVYENLANSGMDIVKAQDYQVEHVFNPAQQFGQQPTQLVVVQPQPQPAPQFLQQPQFFYQEPQPQPQPEPQPQPPQNFAQQMSQQMIQQPLYTESLAKEPRSTGPLQQFLSPTNSDAIFHVQSPPTNILDPFKPFDFHPPTDDGNTFSEDNNSLSTSPSPKPDTMSSTDRPAERACRRIVSGLRASLTQHILGGTPAELGEFPHMAGIGYSRIGGEDRPPYDIRCGGTLIDKRFVLTAAHCVTERESIPSIVRLGVVNFTDPNQMSAAIELRIKRTYIHDDYVPPITYNDIAILELERDVEYSEYIYPVCLYTNESDPDTKTKLWVTGWGTVNVTTRTFSNILLKAPLHTSPLISCNKSFAEYSRSRKIPQGVIRTQLCAGDKDQIKDSCQGDSGGPLNLLVDESYKNYRLVGVVSSGFSCASPTPGLYTKVSAFLEYIEKIVWPNGGD